jgi:uncharacterized membrane protein YhaH (DUF805 family)
MSTSQRVSLDWWKTLFFSFGGRIGRETFWIGILVLAAGWIVPFVLLTAIQDVTGQPGLLMSETAGWVFSLWIAFLFFADFPIVIKRLHDLDMSGWWVLFKFVPLGYFLFLLMLGVFKGTRGPNRYGPDPLDKD